MTKPRVGEIGLTEKNKEEETGSIPATTPVACHKGKMKIIKKCRESMNM
jgi:hypothetical protein